MKYHDITDSPRKPGGGTHIGKGMGMCRGHDPFFQASRGSLAHQITVNVPLSCPLFSIFRKFVHFQPCFGQNASSLDQNFSTFGHVSYGGTPK